MVRRKACPPYDISMNCLLPADLFRNLWERFWGGRGVKNHHCKLSPEERGDFNHAPTEWGGYSLGNAFCSHGTLLPWVLKFLNIELGR